MYTKIYNVNYNITVSYVKPEHEFTRTLVCLNVPSKAIKRKGNRKVLSLNHG